MNYEVISAHNTLESKVYPVNKLNNIVTNVRQVKSWAQK